MKTYDPAPKEVHDRVKALIKRFYPDLENVGLRVDVLMAATDDESGHAVTLHGYPCDATIKILGAKDRAMDRGDVEIVIDNERYDSMGEKERDALIDHELYHVELKRDRHNKVKLDPYGRPQIKMRLHDFEAGWFHEIARRHGKNSGEVQQARALMGEHGQLYFEFAAAKAA